MVSDKQRAEVVSQGLKAAGVPKDRLVKLLKVPDALSVPVSVNDSSLSPVVLLLCRSTAPGEHHPGASRRREICSNRPSRTTRGTPLHSRCILPFCRSPTCATVIAWVADSWML